MGAEGTVPGADGVLRGQHRGHLGGCHVLDHEAHARPRGAIHVDPREPRDTLFLESIVTLDGVSTATFLWNGERYVVREGEALEGTPWKLVSVDGNTVVMLYGDATVTFSIGQGITK